jgi:hypothetical protein
MRALAGTRAAAGALRSAGLGVAISRAIAAIHHANRSVTLSFQEAASSIAGRRISWSQASAAFPSPFQPCLFLWSAAPRASRDRQRGRRRWHGQIAEIRVSIRRRSGRS